MDMEVSGKAFLGIIAYIKSRYGQAEFDKLVELAGPNTKNVFSEKIGLLGWYPYEALSKLLDAIQIRLGKGDPNICRTIGSVAAEKDMGSTYSIYKSKKNLERLVHSCGFIWLSYYRNAGEMVLISHSPKHTVIRINNFPNMTVNHCRMMEGWISAALTVMGCTIKHSHETHCMSRGDPYHEFAFSAE